MGTVLRVPETDLPPPAGVLEELDEVGQFLAGDLFFEAGGHEGDGRWGHRGDVGAVDFQGRAGAGDEGHALGVVAAQYAQAFLSVAGGDRDRLIAADQAGRRLHDGFQKIVGRAHGADAGEFGTHVAALVSESVALYAGVR
jgi:hypothetical protein